MFQIALLLLKERTCAKWFWNQSINVEEMARTSSIFYHFIISSSSVTLNFNLLEQMFQMNNCAKLFSNPFINVKVMAQTTSIYDHFIIWPSSVTLTCNLREQMFQMALFLLKEKTCAKRFWNQCINVGYGPDKLNLWPFYHLIFKCDLDLLSSWTNVSNGTATPQGEQLYQIILKSMHKCRSYGLDNISLWPFYLLTFKCDLDLQPNWTNVLNGTSCQVEQLCQIILKSMACINTEVMARTNLDGCTHTHARRTNIHPTKWMSNLRFYVLFNSVSVILGRWEVDNERLCAMELFRLEQKLCFICAYLCFSSTGIIP